MATVVNKNTTGTPPVGNGTVQVINSGNTPDFNPANWLINPDLSALSGVPRVYWKITGGTTVEEMTSGEKTQVDAELAPSVKRLFANVSAPSTTTSVAPQTKLEILDQKAEGDYVIIVSYGWNSDTTSSSFEARFQEDVDGGGYVDLGEIHQAEPTDSAGSFGATGSSQRYYVTRVFHRSLTSGIYSWRLQWRTASAGTEASIWDVSISVLSVVFDPQNEAPE